jgi:hypothetical protein
MKKLNKAFKNSALITLIAALSIISFQKGYSQVVQTYSSSGTFTAPSGVTSVQVEVWGGGEGGYSGQGGGGGGAYAGDNTVTVVPGNSYTITVGSGGTAGNPGGNSSFASAVIAEGGGHLGNAKGGRGVAPYSIGAAGLVWAGGNGALGTGNGGGGGGGSAGAGGAGGNGINTGTNTGGAGGAAGIAGTGTAGAIGGDGGNNGNSGFVGNIPGSGGGERGGSGSSGKGANGLVIVTYYLSPTITSFTPSNGCANSVSVVITGTNFTGATAVTFGGTNASSFTVNSNTQITAIPTSGTTGKIKVTNSSGTATSAGTFTVKALPVTPTISAGGSTTFCAGGSVTLTSSAGTSYLWSTGATTSSISPTTSGSYTVSVTNASGCQSAVSAAKSVTVNALPGTPTISAGGPTTFCSGGSVTLTSSAGTGYLWSTGATTSNISPTTSGSYTVRVTNASGCQSAASAATAVTVNATPAAPTASVTTQPTCSLATGTITITAPTGAGITYSTDGITYTNTTGVFNSMSPGTYSLTAKNSSGCVSSITSVTVNAQPTAPNISQIPTLNLIANYKFNGNANDATGNDNGTLQNSPATSVDRFNISNSAYNFNGSNQYVSTANSYVNPTDFTISIWFKTNTTSGGKLIGFGNAQTGSSSNYDRHIYMNNAGQIYFGVYPGSVVTVNSPLSYNDNNWHLATATLSSTTGMALYIDGAIVGSNAGNKTAQAYTGYWRIGYDNTNGWTSIPSSFFFNGILDDALIYSRALSASEIATLYNSPDGAGNNGPLCAGATLSFSATTLSGATYAWSGPNSFSSSAQNPPLSYTTANAGVYSLVVTTSGGCTANAYTNVTSLTTPGQWTGNLTSNWNNANNWCSGTLPVISTDVTIPATASNMAVITDNQLCNNILINTGASLNINTGGTLQIAGTITNSGTFNATNGTINMIGTASQTIPANAFFNNALYNLIISNTNAAGVTLGGALDIYGSVTYSGTGKILTTNDVLTLKSTLTNTAWVGDMTGNTITGKVTVERYISARKAWRFLSIPTNTAQTVKQTWQEGCGANLSCVANFGTQITGAGGTAAGFDVYTSLPSMKKYDPPSGTWVGIPNTNSAGIKATDGYMVFVRGDRTAIATSSTPTQTVLRTKGFLYTGNQAAITVSANLFTSIGNPYASALDMRNITKPGIKDFFYVWDPQLAGSYGYGGYQTFSNSGGNYVIIPGGGSYGSMGSINNYIQSGQAFFVQATGAGGSLTLKENAKASGSSLVSVAASIPPPQLRVNLYGVNIDSSTYMDDGFLINYGDNYSNAVDDMDAIKLPNTSENLASKRDNNLLVIESRHSIILEDTIFINLSNVKVQQYQFEFIANQLYKPGLTGILIDNYLNTSTPLNIDGSTIVNFNIANIPGSYAANRFMIVFSQQPTGTLPVTFTSVKAYSQSSNINVEWKVDNESNIKQYVVEKSTDGNQFTSITSASPTNNFGGSASYLISDTKPAEGYNYYRIKSVDVNGAAATSNIVRVLIGKIGQEITVYPNPVINGKINLVLNNQPAGKYGIRIFNKSGQVIKESLIQHSQGNSTETIQLDNYLPKGIYHLEINRPDGTLTNIKVVY